MEDILERLQSDYVLQERSDDSLQQNDFAVITDGKKYYSLSGTFNNTLDKYMALRNIEQLIRGHGGSITYCADEEAYALLETNAFSFLIVTPTITREDVQTFSNPGFPRKGEVFPPKSTRHHLTARPLRINIPLELLKKGDYHFKQEQFKVFMRRKRKLMVTGRLEQYLEKHKILFGEPGELKEPLENPYVWICEFPEEFYEIKYAVDEFTDSVSSLLIQEGMELAYHALLRETNRLILIISDVTDELQTENLIKSLMKAHFPDYRIKNLFGQREDQIERWMIPMEDYTPSRAYFERNERLLRQLVRAQKVLESGQGRYEKVEKEHVEELRGYTSEDFLILFALYVLKKASRCKVFEYLHEDIDDHDIIFSRIEPLISRKLIQKKEELSLTEKGTKIVSTALTIAGEVDQIFRERSPNKFSESLKDIDVNVSHVIKPDGRKDEFHIGSIMESLIFTDIGWEPVSEVLDRVALEFENVDFASSDELTSFVQEYLHEMYPLDNKSFRYDYFINSRDYIFLKDEKVVSLSRKYIGKDLKRCVPSFLKMDARQNSTLSNMVYEGIRLLTVPLMKELYERERIVLQKEFFSQIEEFLVYQAVPVLKKLRNKREKEAVPIVRASLKKAQENAELSSELLDRKDAEFIKYYILAVDHLSESLCLSLGRVPFSSVFRRLGQLAQHAKEDAKNPSPKVMFFTVDDCGRFLRHINLVFRRSKSLLDQWRSLYRKYHEESFLDEYSPGWRSHLTDVSALIERCLQYLDS